jgi:hypothetical protein
MALDMKKFLNQTIAVKTAVGVAASVAAMTAVNASMQQPQAQDVVQHHAKEINDRSNIAAKILEIDRSSLVQKNYLRAAQRIDDFLTGQTKELHLEPSMFEVDGSLEDSSNFGMDAKTTEAFNRVSSQLSQMISDSSADSTKEAKSDSETFDLSKAIKDRVNKDDSRKELLETMTGKSSSDDNRVDRKEPETPNVEKSLEQEQNDKPTLTLEQGEHKSRFESNVDNVVNAVDPTKSDSSEVIKPIEKIEKVDKSHIVETDAVTESNHVVTTESEPEVKDVPTTEAQIRPSEEKPLNIASAINERFGSDKQENRSESITPSSDAKENVANKIEDKTDDSKINRSDQISDPNESVDSRKEDPISTPKESDDSVKEENNSIKKDENVSGTAEISVSVRYGNHHEITNFRIVKTTSGVKHADGSETWESISFTKADLPEEFLSHEVWSRAELLNPDFKATYKPDSSDFKVNDILTMKSTSRKSNSDNTAPSVSHQTASRTLNLKTPNGDILETIVQSEGDSEFKIPQTIGDWFVTDTSVEFSVDDKDIVYQARYEAIEDLLDYQVKDSLDGREPIQKSTQIKTIKKIDKLENKTIESNEESEARKIASSIESAYSDSDLESVDVDTENKVITRQYKSVEKVTEVRTVTTEYVKSATDKIVSSMPTLSNRAEYSKYTSINDQYGKILERSSIEKCVFAISDGSYSYQSSDKQLKPSPETVALLELNNRVTDRLIERINEYRRELGLSEISKQPMTLEQERMFASHAIYNYLANDHSSSKINDDMMKMLKVKRSETMQPVHKLKVANQMLTPEAIADSLFRTILNETASYVSKDGGETGHLEQLLNPNIKTVFAGTFIGSYEQVEQTAKMFNKSISIGSSNDYSLSTTLQYFE